MTKERSRKIHKYFTVISLLLTIAFIAVIDYAEPGEYRGVYDGWMDFHGEKFSSYITISAETRPKWHWIKPERQKYNYRKLELYLYKTFQQKNGFFEIRPIKVWDSKGKQELPDIEILTRILADESSPDIKNQELRKQAQFIHKVLKQLSNGKTLPSQQSDSFVEAKHIQNTAGGIWGMYAVFAWILIWPIYLVLFAPPRSIHRRSPRKVYNIVVAVLSTLFWVFYLINLYGYNSDHLLSYGTLLPSWILFDDHGGFMGRFFSAISWGTFASAVAVLIYTWKQDSSNPSGNITYTQENVIWRKAGNAYCTTASIIFTFVSMLFVMQYYLSGERMITPENGVRVLQSPWMYGPEILIYGICLAIMVAMLVLMVSFRKQKKSDSANISE